MRPPRTTSARLPWIGLALAALLAAGPRAWGVADDELVVRMEAFGDIDDINELYGTSVIASIPEELTFLLDVPDDVPAEVLRAILDDLPTIAWAELNLPIATMDGTTGSFFFYVPPDAYETQYALDLLGAAVPENLETIRVGVLDTGVDATHAALAERIGSGGFDFVDSDADPADAGNGADDDGDGAVDELTGHGTHVSGLVALLAPNAEIVPIRVLDSDGTGYTFQAANGIHHAIDQGARVINLSFTTAVDSAVLANAVTRALEAGVSVVAAAGNLDQAEPLQYPAGYSEAIAVAATDEADLKSGFSSYGPHVALSAPGSGIASTLPGGEYGSADGTSFAAALVSGAAAVLAGQASPPPSPQQIAQQLAATAVDLDALNPEYAGLLGAGRLDLGAAVEPGACDVDGSGANDIIDLLIVLEAWGPNPGHPADLDGDGTVGITDFLWVLSNWGPCD